MLKKFIINSLMLISLCSISSFNNSNYKNGTIINDNIIVDNKKVPLRQKGDVKRSISGDIANIESTNVDYDLRYIYGGEKGYLSFDLWSLKPTSNKDKQLSYKFLCAKPVNNNLYLYVYDENNSNDEIKSANFTISKSKTLVDGEYQESYVSYNARFINSYGFKQRFMKFCIDDIINLNDDVRLKISNGYINYSKSKKLLNEIEDEIGFNVNGNSDYMLNYFKNDYVLIDKDNSEVKLLLTKIDDSKHFNMDGTIGNNYSDWAEDFYYFFNTDHTIDELIEIQYDYQLYNYTESHSCGRHKVTDYGKGISWTTYIGLSSDEGANIISESITPKSNQKIKQGKSIGTVTRPWFAWWNKEYTYNLENIQNCLNLSNLTGDENKGFKTFIEDVQNQRTSLNKPKYQWTFRVGSYLRTSDYTLSNDGWSWLLGQKVTSITKCHEIKQAMITWLKFRTKNQEFEMNVLDIPKDTSSISVQNVPFETLGDVLVDNFVDWWNWFKSNSTNILKNIIPFAISLAVILVIIVCWPLISSFTRLLGRSINSINKKINQKSKKRSNK